MKTVILIKNTDSNTDTNKVAMAQSAEHAITARKVLRSNLGHYLFFDLNLGRIVNGSEMSSEDCHLPLACGNVIRQSGWDAFRFETEFSKFLFNSIRSSDFRFGFRSNS